MLYRVKFSDFKRIAALLIIYLAAFVATKILVGQLFVDDINKYAQLIKNGAITVARIVSVNCQDHDSVSYVFNLGNNKYTSSDLDSNCAPGLIGQNIQILYLPSNPEITTLDIPPTDKVRSDTVFSWIAATLFPAFVIGIFLKRTGTASDIFHADSRY